MGTRITDTANRNSMRGERLGNSLYNLIRGLAWVFRHLVCRCHVEGLEHVPLSGPLLIVSNHLSWYDPFLLGSVLHRRVWFFTKVEVFKWPILGLLSRSTGQIPVHRGEGDRAALEQAIAYVRQGKALVIFPEGTVERQERMIAAHTGGAVIALRSGVPVLPVALSGTRRIFRKRGGWRPSVEVRIGTPYVPALTNGTARKVGLQTLTNEMMGKIAEMLPPEQRGVYS